MQELVDVILQSKSLRRLALTGWVTGNGSFSPKQTPACRNLTLFHTDMTLGDAAIKLLLTGMVNLEELYLDAAFKLVEPLPPNIVPKLRLFSVPQILPAEARMIVAALPDLKCLIIAYSQEEWPAVSQLNNTTVVAIDKAFMHPPEVDRLKSLDSNFIVYMREERLLSSFLVHGISPEVLNYVVKELGFGPNERQTKFVYRPTLYPFKSSNYPLREVVTRNNVQLVKELLNLGATAECPHPKMSYLADTRNSEIRLILLQNGADPNKLINSGRKSDTHPAFLSIIVDGGESSEVVEFLKGKIDMHFKWQQKSTLHWAVKYSSWRFFDVLLDGGVKIEMSSLPSLLVEDQSRFLKVMRTNSYIVDNADRDGSKNLLQLLALLPVSSPLPPKLKLETGLQLKWCMPSSPSKPKNEPRAVTAPQTPSSSSEPQNEIATSTRTPNKPLSTLPLDKFDFSFAQATPTSQSLPLSHEDTNQKQVAVQPTSASLFQFPMPTTTSAAKSGFEFKLDPALEEKLTVGVQKTDSASSFADNPFLFPSPQKSTTKAPDMMSDFPLLPQNPFEPSLPMTNPFKSPSKTPTKDEDDNAEKEPDRKSIKQVIRAKRIKQFIESEVPLFSESEKHLILPALENTEVFDQKSFKTIFEQVLDLMTDKVYSTTTRVLNLLCRSDIFHTDKLYRAQSLLAKGADVNIANEGGWTPLHGACYTGDWSLVELLIDHGARLDVQDKNGVTPLAAAVYALHFRSDMSRPSSFRTALSKCTNEVCKLKEKHTDRTLVHMLATVATPYEFKIIIDKCDVNARDVAGYTPLHYAIYFGNLNLVKYLLENGADANAQTTALKVTPAMLLLHLLTFATVGATEYYIYFKTQMGLFDARPWICKGAREQKKLARNVLPPWFKSSADRSEDEEAEKTKRLITLVTDNGMQNLIDLMAKSDLSLADREGNTLLHLFLQYDFKGAIHRFPAPLCESPFVMLCRHESLGEVIAKLKSIADETKIDLNVRDSRGYSPLYYIFNSSLPMDVKQDWLSFTDVVSSTEYGAKKTILDLYFESQNFTRQGLFALLEKQPGFWQAKDHLGRTLLMRIIKRMQIENSDYTQKELWNIFVEVLKSEGKAIVNIQDMQGDTALHLACKYFHLGFKELQKGGFVTNSEELFFSPAFVLLTEYDADPNIKNNKGETPLDYVPNLHQYEKMFRSV
eukprot:TRINITY_DN1434_c0_g2_i2.p1 TRINITY_DN1434_c0_g2~~TRINITY_DN1434_c0_g2_i2.p1  ORF type:complete len:1287 (+),score=109.12 TRINITY_DN1434_c0_g2_i2:289-3861(+)